MENSDDSIGLFPGNDDILTQWRRVLQVFYPEREMWREWFRHREESNLAWLDGHVSSVRFTVFDRGLDFCWYYGVETKQSPGSY